MALKEKGGERERERENHSRRLNLLSTKHCPLWACVFLLAFALFSLHLGSCTLASNVYMQQQKKTKLADKQKENEETKKVHKGANKQRKAHKGASERVIKQKRVS